MRYTMILLVICVTSTACTTTMPAKPPKPTLTIIERDDGGVCLPRESAIRYEEYVQNLEAGYD